MAFLLLSKSQEIISEMGEIKKFYGGKVYALKRDF